MWGLGLCPFSGLVCDLLLRSRRGLSPKAHYQESISFHMCESHCLDHTGARRRWGFSPELPRLKRLRPNQGEISSFIFFRPAAAIFSTCNNNNVAGRVLVDLWLPQVEKNQKYGKKSREIWGKRSDRQKNFIIATCGCCSSKKQLNWGEKWETPE